MDLENVLKSIDHICLFVAIIIFLVIKFLKYLTSRERTHIKKSSSLFNSLDSPSPK